MTRTKKPKGIVNLDVAERLKELPAYLFVYTDLKRRLLASGVIKKNFHVLLWEIVKIPKMNAFNLMWLVASRIRTNYSSDDLITLLSQIPNDTSVLPIIADKIEDAGCQDVELLSALRMT